jgi:hypothetical protein
MATTHAEGIANLLKGSKEENWPVLFYDALRDFSIQCARLLQSEFERLLQLVTLERITSTVKARDCLLWGTAFAADRIMSFFPRWLTMASGGPAAPEPGIGDRFAIPELPTDPDRQPTALEANPDLHKDQSPAQRDVSLYDWEAPIWFHELAVRTRSWLAELPGADEHWTWIAAHPVQELSKHNSNKLSESSTRDVYWRLRTALERSLSVNRHTMINEFLGFGSSKSGAATNPSIARPEVHRSHGNRGAPKELSPRDKALSDLIGRGDLTRFTDAELWKRYRRQFRANAPRATHDSFRARLYRIRRSLGVGVPKSEKKTAQD